MTIEEAQTLNYGDRLAFDGSNRNATVLRVRGYGLEVHYDRYGVGRWPVAFYTDKFAAARCIARTSSFFRDAKE